MCAFAVLLTPSSAAPPPPTAIAMRSSLVLALVGLVGLLALNLVCTAQACAWGAWLRFVGAADALGRRMPHSTGALDWLGQGF